MAEIDSKVLRYNYHVGRSSTRAVERSIFINLEAGAATLDFVLTPPANWVTISGSRATVTLPLRYFGDMYHMLQTENPVFFRAIVNHAPPMLFAELRTMVEAVGEGPSDPGPGV
jgi:hypothetical protein